MLAVMHSWTGRTSGQNNARRFDRVVQMSR